MVLTSKAYGVELRSFAGQLKFMVSLCIGHRHTTARPNGSACVDLLRSGMVWADWYLVGDIQVSPSDRLDSLAELS